MSYNRNAIATETTCAALFAMAEEWGEAIIWLPSEHQCVLLRNRLYKHRARMRKNAGKVTGVEASAYDGMTFTYSQVGDQWRFICAFDIPMVLTIEIPDWVKPEDLPPFDVPEADYEGVSFAEPDDLNYVAVCSVCKNPLGLCTCEPF